MSYYPPYRSSSNNIKVQLKMMLKILLMLMLVVMQLEH